jgi:uncharacterized protein (DUF1015 family)
MATIKPFCALHPNPFYADRLVFPGDEQVFFFGVNQREFPLAPLKEQLETPARMRPETADGQQLAYQFIRENLQKLLELDRLRRDEQPAIYIYEIVHRNYRQTGIWALTDLTDFADGKIRLHELTLADSERRIGNYRENTGLEGSPVLLTYEPSIKINRIIAEICAHTQKTTVGNKNSLHRIWKIDDPEKLKGLMDAFQEIDKAYMADGHHRLAGTAKLPVEKGGGLISSLYIASDQLRIREYYRVVIPEQAVNFEAFMQQLRSFFIVQPSKENLPVKPVQPNVIGICLHGQWFELAAALSAETPAALLQRVILEPLFGISDPRTDTRLKCIGGEPAMEEMIHVLKSTPAAIGFTLSALNVADLIAAADSNTILPPKSTWIDPKVPYGLLLVQHNILNHHYDE